MKKGKRTRSPRGKGVSFNQGAGWAKLAGAGLTSRQGRIGATDFERQIGEFKSHIAACTSLLAETAATVPLKLYIDDAGAPTGRTEITDHPFLDTWWEVNTYSNHHEFIELIITHLCLTGNAYLYLVPNALGIPAEIHLLPPQNVKIVPSKEKVIGGYHYSRGGTVHDFTSEEVVHFRLPNPFDPFFYGYSLVCKAAVAIADQNNIDLMQDAYFRNLALPGSLIVLREGGTAGKENFERLKAQFEDDYSGMEKVGKPLIASDIQDVKDISSNIGIRDFAFLRGRANIKEEIYSIWKVPLTYGSREATPSRATLENDQIRLATDCIAPMLIRIQEKLNERVMPIYDPDLYCEFDISTIVPPDREFRLSEIREHIASGYSTPDEERAIDGLEPRPDGGGTAGKQINPPSIADLLGEEGAAESEEKAAEEGKAIEKEIIEKVAGQVTSALFGDKAIPGAEGKAKKIGPSSSAQVEKKVSAQRAGMRRKTAKVYRSLSDRAASLAGSV